MASQFNLEKVNVPEIVEGLTAIILSPIILPVAEAMKQPLVQNVIKESIVLSEKYQESVTEATQVWNNVTADVTRERREQFRYRTYQAYPDGKSQVAQDLINVMSDFNTDVKQMTNGMADLRLLVPLALSILAIRQVLVKGLELEDIPWYILAWFAFDSFVKLNNTTESQPTIY
ncbi:DUF5132 domain-containing protein [Nostocaceae cyanobacterium CENA357]|uniref:DUF5132 domain-containing protein n=1 Tax=Atlanticothrix silvestris CENA357 TaxID=1725252 RepID=A0A8J7L3U9_9CYAN|nr:DUF5132 domain-containing protein [Atlanticothrix silvestris]MBH8551332.1 DUF5132 domain-containing protein [Atlanticothrix silvestris CENA357]